MSELTDKLTVLRERVLSGDATDEDRAEYKAVSEAVADERKAMRIKREAEVKAASNGDAIATPATLEASAGVQEEA